MANTPNTPKNPNDNMSDRNRQAPQQGGKDAERGQQQADHQRQGQQGGQRDQGQTDQARKSDPSDKQNR